LIPVARPDIGEEEIEAVARVMRSGMIAQGPETELFEEEFSRYTGTKYAIGVNSGTAALHAALAALGIGPGSEVIVPAFTFIATASAVCLCGARPVFVDVDPHTYTIDPTAVEEAVTPSTKAVIAVHLFGHPAEMGLLKQICDDQGVLLVEDCAQAHGAKYEGMKVGTIGDAGCFSFYPTKNMTTGEGGAITTNDAEAAERMRRFISHGQSEKYLHTEIGYNYRMTDIAASIGRVQLNHLDEMNERRILNAACYDRNISSPDLALPERAGNVTHVYHQYVVCVDEDAPFNRDQLKSCLEKNGIGSAVHYPLALTEQPVFAEMGGSGRCPVSESLGRRVLSLPVHPGISEKECLEVCRAIQECI